MKSNENARTLSENDINRIEFIWNSLPNNLHQQYWTRTAWCLAKNKMARPPLAVVVTIKLMNFDWWKFYTEVCLGLVTRKGWMSLDFTNYTWYIVYIFRQIVLLVYSLVGCVYFRIYRCDFSVNIQVYLISVSYSVHLEACCVYVTALTDKDDG